MNFIAFVNKNLLSFIAQLSLFLRQTLDEQLKATDKKEDLKDRPKLAQYQRHC